MSKMPIIEAKALVKGFRRWFQRGPYQPVLRGIDLEVREAEIHAILGLNGAGKTTLLRLILGLQRPDQGVLLVFGVDPSIEIDWKQQIGYLPEQAIFPFPSQSVWDLLYEQAQRKRIKPENRVSEVERVSALCRIESIVDRCCGSGLSYGQQRRVMLAQALLGSPRLLLLDEPFNGLDIPQMAQIVDLFDALRKQGTTIVLSSHLLPMIERLCDRITLLKTGRILGTRSPDAWTSSMASRYWRFRAKEPLSEASRARWGIVERQGWLCMDTAIHSDPQAVLRDILPLGVLSWSCVPTLEEVFLSCHAEDGSEEGGG